ncbi:MAG TPA: DUF3999 domain-containing protein [Steroidobacteraceae bacterium]|nr:DUF3999 domain-containing protein [Steroidobacteraceae bacterium]
MIRRSIWLCALLLARAYSAEPGAGSPQEFAYGMPITTPAPAAAYRVALPIEVYREAVYEDLRDVRIFNSRGEVVPYELQQVPPDAATASEGPSLPLFPLRGDSRATLDGIHVTIQSQGTAVNVQAGAPQAQPPVITSYVLDARDVTPPLRALQLHWQDDAPEFSGKLRIESSDDLGSWQTLRAEAPVINLRNAGARLVKNRLELPATKAKFWRLSWVGRTAPFEFVAVTADTTPARQQVEHVSLLISGAPVNEKHLEYSFDLGARPPVTQVNIELPESNSVAKIELLSRKEATKPWRPIAHGEFYRVRSADSERRNEPITIPTNSDRYWLARLEQPSSTSGDQIPKLEASWNAEDIVFLARGNGPYLLAYGSGAAIADNAQLAPLLSGVIVLRAEPGAPQTLGGPGRLRPPGALPWKNALLWAALGAGVLLLAWMAYQLSRQLGTRPSGPPN